MSTNTKKIFLTGGAFLPDVTESNNNDIMVVENGKWVMKNASQAVITAGLYLVKANGQMCLIDSTGTVVSKGVDMPTSITNIKIDEVKNNG